MKNKTQETQAITQNNCLPPTDLSPPPCSNSSLPAARSPVYVLSRAFRGMEYPFDQLGSAVLAMLSYSFLWLSHWQTMGHWKVFDVGQMQLNNN